MYRIIQPITAPWISFLDRFLAGLQENPFPVLSEKKSYAAELSRLIQSKGDIPAQHPLLSRPQRLEEIQQPQALWAILSDIVRDLLQLDPFIFSEVSPNSPFFSLHTYLENGLPVNEYAIVRWRWEQMRAEGPPRVVLAENVDVIRVISHKLEASWENSPTRHLEYELAALQRQGLCTLELITGIDQIPTGVTKPSLPTDMLQLQNTREIWETLYAREIVPFNFVESQERAFETRYSHALTAEPSAPEDIEGYLNTFDIMLRAESLLNEYYCRIGRTCPTHVWARSAAFRSLLMDQQEIIGRIAYRIIAILRRLTPDELKSLPPLIDLKQSQEKYSGEIKPNARSVIIAYGAWENLNRISGRHDTNPFEPLIEILKLGVCMAQTHNDEIVLVMP